MDDIELIVSVTKFPQSFAFQDTFAIQNGDPFFCGPKIYTLSRILPFATL